ncbi:MAG: hypothetical protein ACREKM_04015 [Longimicrobiales bacterium]
MAWRRLKAEGMEWEVRAVAREASSGGEDVLEFQPLEPRLPIRRLAVPAGTLESMDDTALLAAFGRARPIGAEHYGRPGKTMPDMNG